MQPTKICDFFTTRDSFEFQVLSSQIKDYSFDDPDVYRKIFAPCLSADRKVMHEATKALNIIQAAHHSPAMKKQFSDAEICKIAIAVAPLLEDTPHKAFCAHQSNLTYPLLIDCQRKAIAILTPQPLRQKSQSRNGDLYEGIEIVANDQGKFICRTIVQKFGNDEARLKDDEFEFAKSYGQCLSALDNISISGRTTNMMTLESFHIDGRKALSEGQIFTADQKILIICQLSKQLLSMHTNGVIHGDIKLNNTLLRFTKSDFIEAQFCDFGFAMNTKKNQMLSGHAYGSFYATAPELWGYDLAVLEQRAWKFSQQELYAFEMFACGIVAFQLANDGKDLFPEELLRKPYTLRWDAINENERHDLPIPQDYHSAICNLLKDYLTELEDVRKNLEKQFTGRKLEELSSEELLCYVAHKLLAPVPSGRLTAEGLFELLSGYVKRCVARNNSLFAHVM